VIYFYFFVVFDNFNQVSIFCYTRSLENCPESLFFSCLSLSDADIHFDYWRCRFYKILQYYKRKRENEFQLRENNQDFV